MPVFVQSTTSTNRHGVFAIEKNAPAVIKAIGTGVVAIAGQFPWGPDQVRTTPAGLKEAGDMFAPPGMSRTNSAYLTLIAKSYPSLRITRVVGPTAAKATATLTKSGPTDVVTVTAKYNGTAGNAIVLTVSAASDGDPNHFDLEATVTGASGTTTDTFKNLNYSGTGDDSAPDFSKALLIGAITKVAAGVPDAGTTTMTGGTDGTVTASEYVGTAGAGDKGLATFEGDKSIRHVVVDDCGNSLRAAVNAGIKAHVDKMGDRVGYVNGNSGQAQAQAKSDVANYSSSDRILYVDPWVYIYDDVDGTERLVPPASFGASLAANLSPSTPIAWKAQEVQKLLGGIVRLESDRGDAAGDNTDAGIATIIQEETGGFTFEADVMACAPVDPTKSQLTDRRMKDYIAVSFVRSTRGSVDQPNVPVNQDDVVLSLNTFLSTLKANQNKDPNHTPHIRDYGISSVAASNSQADLDAGKFTVAAQAKLSSAMAQIFLSMQAGRSVSITVT